MRGHVIYGNAFVIAYDLQDWSILEVTEKSTFDFIALPEKISRFEIVGDVLYEAHVRDIVVVPHLKR